MGALPGNICLATSVEQDETQLHDACSLARFSAVLHAVTCHQGRQRRTASSLRGPAIEAAQGYQVL